MAIIFKYCLLSLAVSTLLGCSTLPSVIENAPAFDLSYQSAVMDPSRYYGTSIRWGGVVIDVENEQNFSYLQLLLYPLGDEGRPRLDLPSEGRFLIKSPQFLDPLVYKKDIELTVFGTLNAQTQRTVGNKTLNLPVIEHPLLHLWPKRNNSYYEDYGFGIYPYHPYWGVPWMYRRHHWY